MTNRQAFLTAPHATKYKPLLRTASAVGIVVALIGPLSLQASPLQNVAATPTMGAPVRDITDPTSLVSEARTDASPVPLSDLCFLRSSWFGTWSPDGKSVVIATDLTGRINLWKVSVDGGFPVQLQQSEDKNFYPSVSPDGKTVVYASDIGGREIYDLFAIPSGGGKSVNLTRSDDASDSGPVAFSPDGLSIAFNRRVATESSTNVALTSVKGEKTTVLTNEKEAGIYWSVVSFTPDGKHLIANRSNAGQTESTAWQIDLQSGTQKKIDLPGPYNFVSAIAPDGKTIAVTTEDKQGRRMAALVDLATGGLDTMRPGAWEQKAGQYSPDGKTVLVSTNMDGRDLISVFNLASHEVKDLALPTGLNADFTGRNPAFSPDGKKILYSHSSGNVSTDWWVYDTSTETSVPITHLGLASVNSEALPKTQIVHYTSRDGMVISAVLWMPFNLKRDGSAPAVVLAHGGPTGQTYDSFDQTAVALASRGYVVIAPNVRGSTGYGRAFEEANRRDLGGGDLEDEAKAAQLLIASGYVSPKKVGITGGSYGGYMTVMAVAKMPEFWAAGVEEYGIVNWRSMWDRGSPALREYLRELLGDPTTDALVYDKTSPLTYLKNAKAPLLVLQGENDIRVPKYEAEQIVSILKAEGRTVEAVYYPEEGHGFLKRENQIDALSRTIGWFDRYLKQDVQPTVVQQK